jgi:hypothetical protein
MVYVLQQLGSALFIIKRDLNDVSGFVVSSNQKLVVRNLKIHIGVDP